MATIVQMSGGAAAPRGRTRPKPARYMIGPDDALQLVLDATVPREPCEVPLEEACGLRLAQEVRADRPQPAFDRAMMDGYGVRVADADGAKIEVWRRAVGGPCLAAQRTDDGRDHARRGRVLFDAGRWAESVEALQQAMERGGLSVPHRIRLLAGIAAVRAGDGQAARDHLVQAAAHPDTETAARAWLASLGE